MPKAPSKTSTERRKEVAEYTDIFSDIIVKKCSTCAKHNRVCRVHLRSGRCSECNHRNQKCDAKVTQSEFQRLVAEKKKLSKSIDEALASQEAAALKVQNALANLRTTRAREERLR